MEFLRKPAVLGAIGVAATIVLALIVVAALLLTGGANSLSANAALIGALIALGGVFTTQLVNAALEGRRAQEARQLETQRAQEAALQKYFEQVGKLLIERPLLRATPSDNLSIVVRAQTLAVLEELDSDRKRILLQFLYESGLIRRDKLVVSLEGANLAEVFLLGANLRGASLSGVNLERSTLIIADLCGADLSEAILIDADLYGADLSLADLSGVKISKEGLANVGSLEGATMLDGSTHD